MVRTFCVDFDDLCDNVMVQQYKGKKVNLVEFFQKWKGETPNLKVTLYTIPKRCSPSTIKSMKDLGDWVALAPHGWRHTKGECLAWSDVEAEDRILAAKDMGIDAPIFRAPGWLLDGDVYIACHDINYTVASHEVFRIPNTGVKEYIYNMHMGVFPPRTRRVHGHLTPVCDNWIYDMHKDGWLKLKGDFVWPWEVSGVVK